MKIFAVLILGFEVWFFYKLYKAWASQKEVDRKLMEIRENLERMLNAYHESNGRSDVQ
jgi:hypothetical protein